MNAEDAVVAHLCSSLSCEVFREVPTDADRPDEFVTVERTGGEMDWFSDSVTFAAQAWAASRCKAKKLAYAVSNAVLDATDAIDGCFAASVSSLSNFTDPVGGTPRYQVVFEINWQG